MINWPIIPMTYNDSFTYMEWLGKLTYIAENHEERIDDCEKNIVDLWEKVNDHEGRIGELEDWRRDTVDPFIVQTNFRLGELEDWRHDTVDPFIASTTETLADHEDRITAAENDIDALEAWKTETVTPFITDINTWKTNTVDPFITNIGGRMTTAETNIDALNSRITAEAAERRNADNAINSKLNNVEFTANNASTKVNRIELQLQNVGAIRYFLSTPTVTTDGTNTTLSVPLPDEDWATIDVRFGLVENSSVIEYRISGLRSETQHQTTQNGKNFWFNYNSTTNEVGVTIMGETLTAVDIYRFDYLLYTGALTEYQEQQKMIEFFNKMDANGDGRVDASDASSVLGYYADLATGVVPDEYVGQDAWRWYCENVKTYLDPNAYPDFNGDGRVDASDASNILGYYAFASTSYGGELTGPELMYLYRTQWEERHNA